ncbi:hypothetical protein BGZ80_002568 [Entomortierella chlamydospora]|uniref:RTA1-domain-containing protein n=1 Tax=Entomortierella chlamydospora TaxID=101097 RepID=A0A9P6SXJ4_9FUNG|nr:hypothetical protein BGZ80_002568 [Entomortierella chlamydospora]
MYSRGIFILLAQGLLVWGKAFAQSSSNTTTTADDDSDNDGMLAYNPNFAGNLILGILYTLLGLTFSYYCFRHKDKWAICLPIGAIASGIGFFIRLTFDMKTVQLGPFILMNCLIVISPSAFLAFNYMLYGRFITAIDPKFGNDTKPGSKMEKSQFSFIPPLIVGRTFIISDILTFFIQISAGGIQASAGDDNSSLAKIGDNLFLAGVTGQGISYLVFTFLLTVAFLRLIEDRKRNYPNQLEKGWTGLDMNTLVIVGGLYISSVFIIVRSVYRIVEFAQGYNGYLTTHEVFLFILDAAPLVLAIGVWSLNWPSILLDRIKAQTRAVNLEAGGARVDGRNGNDWMPLV